MPPTSLVSSCRSNGRTRGDAPAERSRPLELRRLCIAGPARTNDPTGTSFDEWNRAYGVDANWQASEGQRISTFFARTDTPETPQNVRGPRGSDWSARGFYDFATGCGRWAAA